MLAGGLGLSVLHPKDPLARFKSSLRTQRMFLEEHGPSCVGWGGFGG